MVSYLRAKQRDHRAATHQSDPVVDNGIKNKTRISVIPGPKREFWLKLLLSRSLNSPALVMIFLSVGKQHLHNSKGDQREQAVCEDEAADDE